MKCFNVQYDVVLSFAGEDRAYVEKTAKQLRKAGISVFYDVYEDVNLWGKDLYQHLDEIYQFKAKYAIVFISRHYSDKLWTNHELKSAQARAFQENQEYILPVRFDDTEIPGIRKTIGYLDLTKLTPIQLSKKILIKLNDIEPENILPSDLTYVVEVMQSIYDITEEEVESQVRYIFEKIKHTNAEERHLLATMIKYTCGHDFTDSLHEDITLFERMSGFDRNKIKSLLRGLSTLGFDYTITKSIHGSTDLGNEEEIELLSLKFITRNIDGSSDNLTLPFILMYYGAASGACSECANKVHQRLDFSSLNKSVDEEELELLLLSIPNEEDDEESQSVN